MGVKYFRKQIRKFSCLLPRKLEHSNYLHICLSFLKIVYSLVDKVSYRVICLVMWRALCYKMVNTFITMKLEIIEKTWICSKIFLSSTFHKIRLNNWYCQNKILHIYKQLMRMFFFCFFLLIFCKSTKKSCFLISSALRSDWKILLYYGCLDHLKRLTWRLQWSVAGQ